MTNDMPKAKPKGDEVGRADRQTPSEHSPLSVIRRVY